MKTISHLIVLGRIKLTVSLGCFPQNGFLMHSFAHENWKHVQRFHITLSSASALRIWWSYNNCTRGGLICVLRFSQPLPWCYEGWGHCYHYVCRRSRGPVCLSMSTGAGCTLAPAEQRLIENMSVKSNSLLRSSLLRYISTHVPVQERTCMLLHLLHIMLIYN